jgi:hypothetical protein
VAGCVAPPVGKGQPLNNLRNLALWIVIALLLVFLFNLFQGTGSHTTASALTYSKFNELVIQNQVKKVTFQGESVKGELNNGQPFTTTVPTTTTRCGPRSSSTMSIRPCRRSTKACLRCWPSSSTGSPCC